MSTVPDIWNFLKSATLIKNIQQKYPPISTTLDTFNHMWYSSITLSENKENNVLAIDKFSI